MTSSLDQLIWVTWMADKTFDVKSVSGGKDRRQFSTTALWLVEFQWMHASGARKTSVRCPGWNWDPSLSQGGQSIWPDAVRAGITQESPDWYCPVVNWTWMPFSSSSHVPAESGTPVEPADAPNWSQRRSRAFLVLST